jgi:hypothetical protein
MSEIMSQDISKLAEALSKFQGAIESVAKNKTAKMGSYSYSYADLTCIWDAIRQPLMTNGLAISQSFHESPDKGYITTILMHTSGQWIKSTLSLADHQKIQELGSEITYLRRYEITSILGICADEDDDGEKANEKPRKENSSKPTEYKKQIFTPKPVDEKKYLTDLQVENIVRLVGEDKEYCKIIFSHYQKEYGKTVNFFQEILEKEYPMIFERALAYVEKKEKAAKINEEFEKFQENSKTLETQEIHL